MQKRGAMFGFLMITILTILAFIIFGLILSYIFGGVSDEASEVLCETLNAGRVSTSKFNPIRETVGSPQACRIIDKKTLPTGKYAGYSDKKLGEKQEIADLMARCWEMWLKGLRNSDNTPLSVIDPRLFRNEKKQCFPCYFFHVTEQLSVGEFKDYLYSAPKAVKDTSAQCVLSDVGGSYCFEDCSKPEGDAPRIQYEEASSSASCPGRKCCVPASRDSECVSRGGRCEPLGTEINQHTWRCPKGEVCYVDEANYWSYVQYIERGGNGPGFIEFSRGVEANSFKPGTQYAILFAEDNEWGPFNVRSKELDSILVVDYKDYQYNTVCHLEFGASGT